MVESTSKNKEKRYLDLGDRGSYDKKNKLNELTGKEWIRFTKSWKIYRPKPREEKEIQHPAKFPEKLVEDFVRFFTKKEETVLDPFLGTGTTLTVARKLGRNGIGIELLEKYVNIAKERIRQLGLNEAFNGATDQKIIQGDATNLLEFDIPKIDYCLTSPPYWKMLRTSRGGVKSVAKKRKEEGLDQYYSDDPRDLGNLQSYSDYIKSVSNVLFQVYKLLKEGGYITVVVQNVRTPEGKMKPLAWDLAKNLSKKYVLKQEKIWCQDDKPLGIWGYPKEYVSNVHHHYCLILKKENT